MKTFLVMSVTVFALWAQPVLASGKTDHVIGYGETKSAAEKSANKNFKSDGACGPNYRPVLPPSKDYKEEWVKMATGWSLKISFGCRKKG